MRLATTPPSAAVDWGGRGSWHWACWRRWRSVNKNVITYSAAITACEKGQQWQIALELLAEMTFAKVGRSVIAFSAAISASEK